MFHLDFPPQDILEALREVKAWAESNEPKNRPLNAIHILDLCTVRSVQEALLTVEGEEYSQLESFYANNLRHDVPHRLTSLEALAWRSNTEFKFLREYCGFSQQELADKLGTSLSSERRWENRSETYNPPIKAWKQIDDAVSKINADAKTVLDQMCSLAKEYDYDETTGEEHPITPVRFTLLLFTDDDNYAKYLRMRKNILRQTPEERRRAFEDCPEDRTYMAFAYGTECIEPASTYSQHNALMRVVYTLATAGNPPVPVEHVSLSVNVADSE